MKKTRRWNDLSLSFRQCYSGGYRYLDRCGEFMLAAEQRLDVIPKDMKPTGGKLEHPDYGISANVDVAELRVTQESSCLSSDNFMEIVTGLSALVAQIFEPTAIDSSGLAIKQYLPSASADDANKKSLDLLNGNEEDLSRLFNMQALSKNVQYTFRSGSYDLIVKIDPFVFDRIGVEKRSPPFNASSALKRQIERRNRRADQLALDHRYGVMMTVDVIELQPPPDKLAEHLEFLLGQRDMFEKAVSQ